jgi:hypothetical protein
MKKPHIIMEINEEQTVEEQQPEEQDVERTDWKAKAIEIETKYKSDIGSLKRELKDLKKPKTEPSIESPPQDKKPEDLDYGQKAFLIANGIKADEQEFVKEELKKSGQTLDELIDNEYFQAKLKRVRDLRGTEEATPKNSKRTGQSATDTVEYWIAKGELPPDRELRAKVVKARWDAEKNKNVFSN